MRFVFAIFLLVLANTQCQLLPEGQNVKYSYSALVQNTIQEPESVVSQYLITAHLNLNTFKNYTRLSFENVKFSLYNGKVQNIETTTYHKGDSSFNTPFLVKHDFSGRVQSVFTKKTDEKWAADMKKSIATLFQFDITKVHLNDNSGHSTEAMESTPFGNCLVNYMYTVNSSDLTLEKWHSLSSCKEYETKANLIDDNNYYKCQMSFQDSLNADNEKSYKIKVRDDGLVLTDIKSFNRITFSYFNAKAEVQMTQIRQELSMIAESTSDKKHVDKIDVNLDKYQEHLAENFHNESSSFQFFSDWDEQDIEHVAQQIMVQLKGIDDKARKYLQTDDDMSKSDSYSISSLLSYFRPLSSKQLSLIHSEIKKMKMGEKTESLFYKILPFVGTHDSIEFVLSLVRDNSIEEDVAVSMIQNLPFNIRKPDVKILDKFYTDTHDLFEGSNENIKYACWLSLATILAKVSQNNPNDIEKTRHIIDMFIISLDKSLLSQDYRKKLVLISCLQNILSVPHIHTYRVSKFLEIILKKGVEINEKHRENVLTSVILAGKRVHSQDDKVLQSIYLPILRDQTYDSFHIQAAAIDVLMKSPSMHIQTMLFWIMRNREDDEIFLHYHSSVFALTKAKDPCLHVLARNARKISQMLIKENLRGFNTRLMVDYADYYDEKYGFGASQKLELFNGVEGTRKLFLESKKYVTGLFSTTTSMYMRGLGMSYDLFSPKSTEDSEVEMFLIRDGCVCDMFTMDSKTMEKVIKSNSMNELFKDKYLDHFENYFIDMIQTDFVVPTDIGLPVRAFVELPDIHRLEYNITFETGKLGLKFKWNKNSEQMFGMVSYAPLADVWHGSRRVYNIQGALGLDIEIRDQPSIYIKLNNPLNREPGAYGFKTFVKSEVFIFEGSDDGMFKKCCPECNNVEVAQRPKDFLRKRNIWSNTNEYTDTQTELVIFDCDRDITEDKINLEKHKVMEEFLSSKGVIGTSTMMKMRHLWALAVSSPEPGTCGTAFYIRPRDGVSNKDWFSSVLIRADQSSPPKFKLSFNIDYEHKQKQIEMLADYKSYSMEVSKKTYEKGQTNHPGQRMCITTKKSDPKVDDSLVIYVEIKQEEFQDYQKGCIGNDTNIVLSMKRDDNNILILHYDFKWEKLQQHMSDLAFNIGDRFRKILSQNFARIYGKSTRGSKNELKLTVMPNYIQEKLDVIVESPFESFGYFNITVPYLQPWFSPQLKEVENFKADREAFLNTKESENKIEPRKNNCEWTNLYEIEDLTLSEKAELPEINATLFVYLDTVEKNFGKTINMHLVFNYTNGNQEEIEVLQKGKDIHIFHDGDLQETGVQYGSFGKGMIKYKINEDKEVELFLNPSKRLVYNKDMIKYILYC